MVFYECPNCNKIFAKREKHQQHAAQCNFINSEINFQKMATKLVEFVPKLVKTVANIDASLDDVKSRVLN